MNMYNLIDFVKAPIRNNYKGYARVIYVYWGCVYSIDQIFYSTSINRIIWWQLPPPLQGNPMNWLLFVRNTDLLTDENMNYKLRKIFRHHMKPGREG